MARDLKELKEIMVYSKRLGKLLNSQEEQPSLADHQIQEEKLKANPDIKVLLSLKMPPSVQALRWEMQYIQEQCRMLLSRQDWNRTLFNPELDRLERRLSVVECIMNGIIMDEVANIVIGVPRLQNVRMMGLMGDNWFLRFVEMNDEEEEN